MIQRTIFVDGDTDLPITVDDGRDGLAEGTDSMALRLFAPEVYIGQADWERLKRIGDEYFADKAEEVDDDRR